MKKRNLLNLIFAVLFLLLLPGIGGRLDARAESWKFGNQLKGREKEIYQILEKNYSKLKNYKKVNGFTARLRKPMTYEEAVELEWFRPQWAFLLDYSDLFWISQLPGKMVTEEDRKTGDFITNETMIYSVDRYPSIRSEIKKAQKNLRKAIAVVKERKGRYAKVKAAHDYIIELTTYPVDVMPAYYHAVTGPLLKKYANQGVCEAYAWLFDIICKANDIPCIILEGNNHAWNYVQMDDGKWYLVDTTWDDVETGRYDYFLVGSETVVNGKTLKQTHNVSSTREIYRLNNVKPMKYPTLSKEAYKKKANKKNNNKKNNNKKNSSKKNK